jgi:hypothetical protein
VEGKEGKGGPKRKEASKSACVCAYGEESGFPSPVERERRSRAKRTITTTTREQQQQQQPPPPPPVICVRHRAFFVYTSLPGRQGGNGVVKYDGRVTHLKMDRLPMDSILFSIVDDSPDVVDGPVGRDCAPYTRRHSRYSTRKGLAGRPPYSRHPTGSGRLRFASRK